LALIVGVVLVAFAPGPLGPSILHSQGNPAIYNLPLYASYQFHTLEYPSGILASYYSPYMTIYISDMGNNVIRAFDVGSGTLSTIAGNGTAGYMDGSTTSAEFNHPTGLYGGMSSWNQWIPTTCTAQSGGPYISKCGYWQTNYYTSLLVNDAANFVVREVCTGTPVNAGGLCNPNVANRVYTVAGNHTNGFVNGSNASAEFGGGGGLSSSYYIADTQNSAIRKWDGSNVTTFAGTGTAGFVNGYRTSAEFNSPMSTATDSSGNMYVVDYNNNVVRKINTSGYVTTFAGSGSPGLVDGGPTIAEFRQPCGIVFNSADGYLYVVDSGNNSIRRLDLSGNVVTYAGSQRGGLVNGARLQAQFQCPMGIAIYGGYMYIADSMNNAIRRVDMAAGVVSTYID